MSEQWIDENWERQCRDHGPTGHPNHDFTGYHHMCCLNNMIPLRANVHELFNTFEIAIYAHVRFVSCCLECLSLGTPQDNNCVISFSEDCADLAERHLYVDDIPLQQRPLTGLLADLLSQGVFLHCLYPGSRSASHQPKSGLSSAGEPPDDRQDEPNDSEAGRLSVQQGGGDSELVITRCRYNRFKPEERERGEGKYAFENYLAIALSVREERWGGRLQT
jgi:hypothetical protein